MGNSYLEVIAMTPRGLSILRAFVMGANIVLAALAFINLYTLTSGAIKVYVPTEEDIRLIFTEEGPTLVTNFTVVNRGFYDIYDVRIDAELRDAKGRCIMEYHRHGIRIPAGSVKNYRVLIPVKLDFDDAKALILGDTTYTATVRIEALYMWGLSRFVLDESLEYTWRSLKEEFLSWLKNLTLGELLDLITNVEAVCDVLPGVLKNVEGLGFNLSFTLNSNSSLPLTTQLTLYYRGEVFLDITFTCDRYGVWEVYTSEGVIS
ncbi:MAG: hypothetical protein DRN28_02715 [Thermoplasmata archaeon]|nr:MAG: hypothetical protein DRN28_02715 [Thermoplasmata archaeon]